MKNLFRRNLLLHINKYQGRIIFPVLTACSIACLMTLLSILLLVVKITNNDSFFNFDLDKLQNFIPWFLFFISCILFFVMIWTYYCSNKILGPFNRVMKELDNVINGKKEKLPVARKGDEMFNQILKRINILIDKMK